jgi:hypothetical protein
MTLFAIDVAQNVGLECMSTSGSNCDRVLFKVDNNFIRITNKILKVHCYLPKPITLGSSQTMLAKITGEHPNVEFRSYYSVCLARS